ncbi:hypothetical protein DH2020_028285 [Rehmannia glutinosa]|uniref:RBR-type E3 ubiquitin transferase n=1 Tax=Rehmannia glutinosa TaxID=99300 RepID=A0ABR0VUK1_REHGL
MIPQDLYLCPTLSLTELKVPWILRKRISTTAAGTSWALMKTKKMISTTFRIMIRSTAAKTLQNPKTRRNQTTPTKRHLHSFQRSLRFRGVACTLLCQNNWSLSSVYEKWFSDENKIPEEAIGKSAIQKSEKLTCKVCYETINITNMLSADCGHLFCSGCWKFYISTSIKDGPGCLTLNCPEPGCKSNPGLDMVDLLSSRKDKDKYYGYLYRSYIESNTKRKWCPAPGCDFAIEFESDGSYEVTCDCGYKFCWNCGEESHRPLDCETVAKWIEKNSSEAESTTWILAYTKPCPKCRRAIEKNQGCNRMRCREPCGFEFCWACLEPWSKHGYVMYDCNKFKEEGDSPDERSRKKAKKHLERYTHYYERWDSNDKSRKRALIDLDIARNEHVDLLVKVQEETQAQLKFVIEAWDQIVECRRVLKWSYAYGYYLSLSKSGKVDFFGHLQGQAESALERLHHCAEKEMSEYLSGDCRSEDFKSFRSKLAGLTSVTRNYFENLVTALENDLSEVENRRD